MLKATPQNVKAKCLNANGRDSEPGRQTTFMWHKIITWLAEHLRSRYVRMLEADVERLRAENRALVNSLLGTAGFPPLAVDEDARRGSAAMTAVRRRTWTQIAREREMAAGKGAGEK
jgi:hypothetical protein